jgi:hypothetical protein
MQADGVPPNARFFTEYIRICGRAGSMQASTARQGLTAWQALAAWHSMLDA